MNTGMGCAWSGAGVSVCVWGRGGRPARPDGVSQQLSGREGAAQAVRRGEPSGVTVSHPSAVGRRSEELRVRGQRHYPVPGPEKTDSASLWAARMAAACGRGRGGREPTVRGREDWGRREGPSRQPEQPVPRGRHSAPAAGSHLGESWLCLAPLRSPAGGAAWMLGGRGGAPSADVRPQTVALDATHPTSLIRTHLRAPGRSRQPSASLAS